MKYANCPIGVAALDDSHRTWILPLGVCTPARLNSASSARARFNFDSPIG
jgi:hypothetical protein